MSLFYSTTLCPRQLSDVRFHTYILAQAHANAHAHSNLNLYTQDLSQLVELTLDNEEGLDNAAHAFKSRSFVWMKMGQVKQAIEDNEAARQLWASRQRSGLAFYASQTHSHGERTRDASLLPLPRKKRRRANGPVAAAPAICL